MQELWISEFGPYVRFLRFHCSRLASRSPNLEQVSVVDW